MVDLKQLTNSLMVNLEATLRDKKTELSPEMMNIIGQNEAKKMFTAVANMAGENDIIIPKSVVLHSPARYEITSEIAESLGIKGIVETNVKSMIQAVQIPDSK